MPLVGLLLRAMLTAVLVFGKEKKAAAAQATTRPRLDDRQSAAGSAAPRPLCERRRDGRQGGVHERGLRCLPHVQGRRAARGRSAQTSTISPRYAQQAEQGLGKFTVEAIIHPPRAVRAAGFPKNAMPTTFGTTPEREADRRSGRVPRRSPPARRGAPLRGLRYDAPALEKWPSG